MSSMTIRLLLERASMDQEAVEALALGAPNTIADEPIGQLAQQMVEKLARAVLLTAKVKIGSEHDLREIFSLLRQMGAPVPAKLKWLEDLTPFALRLRYDTMQRLNVPPLDRDKLLADLHTFDGWARDRVEGGTVK